MIHSKHIHRTVSMSAVLATLLGLAACDTRTTTSATERELANPPANATTPSGASGSSTAPSDPSGTTGSMAPSSPASPDAATGSSGTSTSPSVATAEPISGATSSMTLAGEDRDFAMNAASGGLLEVEASRLAMERTKNKQIKTFAQRMVSDHTKVNDELKAILTNKGMSESPQMTATHAAQLESLRALQGPAFDKAYVQQAGVAAHQEAVGLFERGARNVSDSDLKSFAQKHLPHLQQHHGSAEALAKSVMKTGTT